VLASKLRPREALALIPSMMYTQGKPRGWEDRNGNVEDKETLNSQTHLRVNDSKPELTPTLDTGTPPRMDVRALNNLLDTETPPRRS